MTYITKLSSIFISVTIIIITLTILSSCTLNILPAITPLPRDEIEIYELGVDFWNKGQYEVAIRILSPFLEKDSLYFPLYTILADSYYRLAMEEEAASIIDKAILLGDSPILENLNITFKALENKVEMQQERVSFPQYLDDVANRYAIDKALLYALISEGSSFNLNGIDSSSKAGLLGLTKEQALAIGLNIPDQDNIEEIALFQHDERLDPAKSIYYSARYLSSLLDDLRVGKRSNLVRALTTFYTTGIDSLFSIPQPVNNVVDYFQYYRHNIVNQEQAVQSFYQNGDLKDNPFVSSSSLIADDETNYHITAYKDAFLETFLSRSLGTSSEGEDAFLETFLSRSLGTSSEGEDAFLEAFLSRSLGTSSEGEGAFLEALPVGSIGTGSEREGLSHEDSDMSYEQQRTIYDSLGASNSQKLSLNPEVNTYQSFYLNNIALICDMLNDYENADLLYSKALALSPADEIIILNYGIFLFETGDYEKALNLLERIPRESKRFRSAVLIKGYCLLLTDRLVELSLLPDEQLHHSDPHLYNLKGLYLFQLGEKYNALQYFYRAFELSSEPIFAANYLAVYYQLLYPNLAYAKLTRFNKIMRLYDTGFIWPLELRYISSGYGWRPSPFHRNWLQRLEHLDFHNGIDLPGSVGIPVRASAAGEVITSQRFPLGGETIFIQHPDHYITTYLHLERRFVEEGEIVQQGQIIGLLGNTGQSTGPHLHFGMFNNKNQTANPLNYLPVY